MFSFQPYEIVEENCSCLVQVHKDIVRSLLGEPTLFKRIVFILTFACAAFSSTLPANASAVAPAVSVMQKSVDVLPHVQHISQKLIGSSQAARIARGVAPQDKLLGVRLSRGSSPRYVVKTRGNGRVREIVIDARTGAILKR